MPLKRAGREPCPLVAGDVDTIVEQRQTGLMMRAIFAIIALAGCTFDREPSPPARSVASVSVADDEDAGAELGCYIVTDDEDGGLFVEYRPDSVYPECGRTPAAE